MGVWGVFGQTTALAVRGSGPRAFPLKSHNIFKNTFLRGEWQFSADPFILDN